MNDHYHAIRYEFHFENGGVQKFELLLDPKTVSLVNPESKPKPEWARLECHQCRCCTLDRGTYPYCPIAVNISELMEGFKDTTSTENCTVRVITPERTYSKDTTIQDGLFSIIGIIMPTSNCPVMNYFKPMARFHLPFSTIDETIFRATSIHLLRQYFEYKKGNTPDLEFKKLDRQYELVQQVNQGILGRIGIITREDADKNAIIILNALAQMLSMGIEENLNSLTYLFDA